MPRYFQNLDMLMICVYAVWMGIDADWNDKMLITDGQWMFQTADQVFCASDGERNREPASFFPGFLKDRSKKDLGAQVALMIDLSNDFVRSLCTPWVSFWPDIYVKIVDR